MSTFKGVMKGFEDVRVDYFRPTTGLQNPRACFVSHVHSDHLQGLESKLWRTSPIYCSPATREILLRLETKVNRIGYETKGLEARKVQYGHLEKLLKPIPLETPTQIELKPGVKLQVTLFDANHCTGAVMFLFELDGTAVLYTGDIRSEPWFVNSLTRNPLLIEYTSGLKTLDCIYLDTSNTEPRLFPPKADGLKELLGKVSKYPPDTVFHFTAWTYGYEEVWMALSKALKSQIHVSKYAYSVYKYLRGETADKKGSPTSFHIPEGAALTGYTCGNGFQSGCLTTNPNVPLHSCEKGIKCPLLDEKTVWIQPIVRRRDDGTEEAEPAVVQAGNDLSGCPQVEFDDGVDIDQLMTLFTDASDIVKQDARQLLSKVLRTPGRVLSLPEFGEDGDVSLTQLTTAVIRAVTDRRDDLINSGDMGKSQALPRVITFPYSRHSSYEELCELLNVFKPKDVWPCTENPYLWHETGVSIEGLFGELCSENDFRYDGEMREKISDFETRHVEMQSQTTASSQPSARSVSLSSKRRPSLGTSAAEADGGQSKRSWIHDDIGEADISRPEAIRNELPSPDVPKVVFQRNEHGQLRPFDVHGNQVDMASRAIVKDASATPSNLRRKSSSADLDSHHKRSRLSRDGPGSSPTDNLAGQRSNPYTISSDASDADNPDTPGSEVDDEEREEDTELLTFPDHGDDIFRCKACEHEVWGGKRGSCTHCDQGASGSPYMVEISGPAGRIPQITLDAYMDEVVVDSAVVKEIVGDCLDYDSSAYDSQDSADNFQEEYEVNSFIDDEEVPDTESEDEAESSSETDWEAKFKALQTQHAGLQKDFNDLIEVHYELRRDVFGSDMPTETDEDGEIDDEMDEDGMLIVDVSTPNPIATDIILSQAREQSQDSELSDGRIRDRAEAFEAARDGGWHDISLTSVAGNHTHAEIEL
ncbi:hypothetical protein BKA65DRAFT_437717 [Rhexocercosporidium sp. MPI-PUGE-AT-0058]|nr:hypothetical protein BKA65DRAFT_437717 [Rhexocercosporidium sp. MPI-PUGE-AT-0058]